MNTLASCQCEECQSKDTCKRYNTDGAIINFKAYMEDDNSQCEYYIKKDEQLETKQ